MAGRYDFTIKQGSTFSMSVSLKEGESPFNLTDYTGRMQIRYNDHNGAVAADLNVDNGGIVVDVANNQIVIHISAEDTAKIDPLKCLYDLEIVQDDYVERILEGIIRVSPEVTK